jgi:uncharacterized protein (TIGR02145 family)
MKKITTLSFLFLVAISVYSQNYFLNFTGSNGNATVNTVKVENLTQGTSIILDGLDILNLKAMLTGNNTVYENSEKSLKVYPNPATQYCNIEFTATASANVVIIICNPLGKIIAQNQINLTKGTHTYQITGLNNGIYSVQITSEMYTYTGKIISQQNGKDAVRISYQSSNNINKTEKQLKSTTNLIQMQYNVGDRLKLTGTSGNYSTVWTDIPTESKTIAFDFIACTDGDNHNYSVVKIGSQTWMAEDLKTTHYADGTSVPKVADNANWDALASDSQAYCWYKGDSITYSGTCGALYTWAAVMKGSAGSTKIPSGIQGACPTGWHIPSDAEWTTLENYLITNGYNYDGTFIDNKISKALAATNTWYSITIIGSIGNTDYSTFRNKSGFTALPDGCRRLDGSFDYYGLYGYWWTATEGRTGRAWCRYMGYANSYVYRYDEVKEVGFSVRCLKD